MTTIDCKKKNSNLNVDYLKLIIFLADDFQAYTPNNDFEGNDIARDSEIKYIGLLNLRSIFLFSFNYIGRISETKMLVFFYY